MMSMEVLEQRREEMLREAEPVEEGAASGSQGAHRLQMGLDRGLGGDEGRRPPPQVFPDEERRLGP